MMIKRSYRNAIGVTRKPSNDYNAVLQETDLAASTRELLLRQKQSIDTANSTMARLAQTV